MSAWQVETVSIPGFPSLHGQFWCEPGAPRPGVLLCHGFASCLKEWAEFPERLAAAGYAVLAFDFRGHGRSDGARTHVTAVSHLDDTQRALDVLLARPEVDGRFALVGHSLGTAAVLRTLGTEAGGKAAAAVLFAPPNRIRQDVGLAEWLGYALASRVAKVVLDTVGTHLYVPYRVTEADIFLDPEAQARAKADGILARQITLNNYDYMMAEQDNAAAAAHVQVPVRLVVGGQDKVIAVAHSRQVYDAVPTEAKSWIEIPDSGHSLLGDRSRDLAADAGLTWLQEFLPPQPVVTAPNEAPAPAVAAAEVPAPTGEGDAVTDD